MSTTQANDKREEAPAMLVGYMDAAKFKALQATAGGQGGVLTMVTSHRAFPEDVALYAVLSGAAGQRGRGESLHGNNGSLETL